MHWLVLTTLSCNDWGIVLCNNVSSYFNLKKWSSPICKTSSLQIVKDLFFYLLILSLKKAFWHRIKGSYLLHEWTHKSLEQVMLKKTAFQYLLRHCLAILARLYLRIKELIDHTTFEKTCISTFTKSITITLSRLWLKLEKHIQKLVGFIIHLV